MAVSLETRSVVGRYSYSAPPDARELNLGNMASTSRKAKSEGRSKDSSVALLLFPRLRRFSKDISGPKPLVGRFIF